LGVLIVEISQKGDGKAKKRKVKSAAVNSRKD